MSRHSLSARWLDACIAITRIGPVVWLAIVLGLCSAVAQVWWLQDLREQRDTLAQRLEVARRVEPAASAAVVANPSPSAERLRALQEVLGASDRKEELIRSMFAMAKSSDLTLAEGDYSASVDKSGMYVIFEVSQPVRGTYPQIREYCERVLLNVPFAALDGLQIKREGVATAVGDAKAHWVFYLRPATLAINTAEKAR